MAVFDSTLSDPYISNLLSSSSEFRKQQSPSYSMSSFKTSTTGSGQGPNLIQFLESVPPPVTLLLVELAPVISWVRWAAEVASWKSHWTDPWLTLAVWWALCLGADVILRRAHVKVLLPHMADSQLADTSCHLHCSFQRYPISLSDVVQHYKNCPRPNIQSPSLFPTSPFYEHLSRLSLFYHMYHFPLPFVSPHSCISHTS